jgi:hemoglobin-like flavoprotein
MSPSDIASVRASYLGLAPSLDQLVHRFYTLLFERHPEIRPKFPTDMERQKFHLAAALAILFRNLDNFGALEQPLMSLGAAHVGYGVKPEHYPLVREIMLESIRSVAGEAWSSQLEGAWREALSQVCSTMLKGAAAAALSMAREMAPPTGATGRAHGA